MTKKKAILLSITILFIGLIITAGSYAFWSWSSNTNKNIVFNTSKELRNYIIYDEGESKFVGDFQVSNSYTGGIHSTISLYKTNAASNVDLIATIYMDINAIGNAMKQSTALKWKVTVGDTSNIGATLAQGNFVGVNSGDTLTLVPNIEVTTTLTKYTIWIWIDATDNPSDDMVGETFDSNIWTEINQTESSDLIYQITRTSANYQTISATVVNNENKIVKYAVTSTNTEPAANSNDWVSIPVANQSKTYNLNTSVNSTGTYYIWFMDEEDNVINAEIEVEDVDTTGPTCTFGNWNKQTVDNNATAQITLTCTDDGSSITNYNLTTSDLTLSNNYVTLTNITKTSVTNGYSYQITVTGTNNDGDITLTLPANKVKNAMHYGNSSVTSGSLTVFNDVTPPAIALESQSSTSYANSYEVPVYLTDDVTGIASGASVKYGWSTSNSIEPSTYETPTLDYTDGDLGITVIATGSGLDGEYYLWVVPLTLVDKKGNANTTTVISSGTFKFDNDTITAPTISFESNVVTNGLIFGFDGRNNTGNGYSSSASTWNNYGSSNTNGTINGATWGNGYLEFDGTDDYVTTEFLNYNYYTVEAQFSVDSYTSGVETVVIANYDGGGFGISFSYDQFEVHAYANGEYHGATDPSHFSLDTIYSISATYDGSFLKLYVNGTLVYERALSGVIGAPPVNTKFALGCNPNVNGCDGSYLDGKIYSARIYNRALTDSEVKQNYKADKMALGEYVNGTPNFTITGGTSLKGISGYQYALNAGEWTTYNSSSKPTITTEGENIIDAKALNIHSILGDEASTEVYLDNTIPTVSLNVSANEDTLVATVTASDTLSGLRELYGYKVSTSSTCNSTTTGFIDSTSNEYNFTINSAGQHYVCVRVEDNAGNYNYALEEAPSNYYEYTGDYETFVTPETGYYKIEAWGAQGGGNGGKGAYASGYINLIKNDTYYVYVGGVGGSSTTSNGNAGGYNGGGAGGYNGNYHGFGGGGATDIRLSNTEEYPDSYGSRLIVAAGGGAGYTPTTNYTYVAGDGGDLIGKSGGGTFSNANTTTSDITTGGTQVTGGTANYGTSLGGSFGYAAQTIRNSFGGGGGGGYYGGASGYGKGGAGGSSFISGYAGVSAPDIVSYLCSNDICDSGDWYSPLHVSGKYFINGHMIAGENTGAGKARITYVGSAPARVNTKLNNVRYIKDCIQGNSTNGWNAWVELQAIKDGVNVAKGKTPTGITNHSNYGGPVTNITDGIIDKSNYVNTDKGSAYANECIVVDLEDTYNLDEVAVWHYYDGRTYNNNFTFASSNGSDWVPIMHNTTAETSNGSRVNAWEENDIDFNSVYNYGYIGNNSEFTVPINGYYKVETWGAQGGNGGKGGYSSGYINLSTSDKLYIYAGGSGPTNSSVTNVGGWNGGGYSGNNSNAYSYGGGGATDIRLTSGTWNDTTSLNSRIMVAGGGGGSFTHNSNTYTIVSGAGGTLLGADGGGSYSGTDVVNPTAGTQNSGGTYGRTGQTYGDGTFGSAYQSNTGGYGGGGGSGYYGGGNGYGRGGAGGSSFISGYAGVNAITSASDRTHTNNTLHYSEKYFIKNTTTRGNNSGNGKAVITYVGAAPERINSDLNNVRYVKDCINGSSANAGNHWVELQVIKDGINIAKNKTITGTAAAKTDIDALYSYIVDGSIDNGKYGESVSSGLQCITVDLGATYNVDEIAIWHWWADGREYYNNITYVSSDNSTWNPAIKNNDAESPNGKRASAWSPSAAGKYYVNYNDNLFVANTGTTSGVTINYDTSTQYLTLNGTWSAKELLLWNNERRTVSTGEKYQVKLTYVSGSYTTSVSPVFVIDLTTNGNTFSDRATAPKSFTNTGLPTSGSKTASLTVDSSRATANGLEYWLWQATAGETTFTNYVVRVEITTVHSKEVEYEGAYGTLETPVKNGHTFLGWYTALNGGTQVTSATVLNTMSDQTIYAHWSRNKIYIKYNMNGGTWAGSTNTHLSTSNNWVTYDGNSNTFWAAQFGESRDLANYNYSGYINISRTNYIGKSGQEWCTGTTGNGTCYNQDTVYSNIGTDGTASTHFCDARNGDCTVSLYVNWIANNAFSFTYNGGFIYKDGSGSIVSTYQSNTSSVTINIKSSTWWVKIVSGSGKTFKVNSSTSNVDLFVVGGGGGGGYATSGRGYGGGGAGGRIIQQSNKAMTGNYTVTIGSGGAANAAGGTTGIAGSFSGTSTTYSAAGGAAGAANGSNYISAGGAARGSESTYTGGDGGRGTTSNKTQGIWPTAGGAGVKAFNDNSISSSEYYGAGGDGGCWQTSDQAYDCSGGCFPSDSNGSGIHIPTNRGHGGGVGSYVESRGTNNNMYYRGDQIATAATTYGSGGGGGINSSISSFGSGFAGKAGKSGIIILRNKR